MIPPCSKWENDSVYMAAWKCRVAILEWVKSRPGWPLPHSVEAECIGWTHCHEHEYGESVRRLWNHGYEEEVCAIDCQLHRLNTGQSRAYENGPLIDKRHYPMRARSSGKNTRPPTRSLSC